MKRTAKFDFPGFERASLSTVRRYLTATGADIRKGIKASLKSGGKIGSKTFRTSAPGEPPKTHGSRLKQSIRYDVERDGVKVGAPSLSGRATAAILEKGGVGEITETTVGTDYFERRRKRARKASKDSVKPKTKRAYTIKSEDGSTRRVSKYERFKSEQTARRGVESSGFRDWRASIQRTTTTNPKVAARPFVAPAAKFETENETARQRWARIVRSAVRNGQISR